MSYRIALATTATDTAPSTSPQTTIALIQKAARHIMRVVNAPTSPFFTAVGDDVQHPSYVRASEAGAVKSQRRRRTSDRCLCEQNRANNRLKHPPFCASGAGERSR